VWAQVVDHAVQIARVAAVVGVTAAACCRDGSQCRRVKFRHRDVAGRILEKAAVGRRDWRALSSADAEHRDAHAGSQRFRCGRSASLADRIGDENDLAFAQAGLLHELDAQLDRARRVVAGDRHDARLERVDEILDRVRVVSQRRNDEGIAGVGDQRGLRIAAPAQDVDDLVARARRASV
jgi:hypothetical protein